MARAFNIATKGDRSKLVEDFITFMLSAEGQALANENYISVNNDAEGYTASNLEGKLVVAGSSSVSPLMEKFAEAYSSFNPNVVIEVQANDSTAGMNGAIEGTCDIGMASRDLKESELEHLEGYPPNGRYCDYRANNNPIDNLSTEQAMKYSQGRLLAGINFSDKMKKYKEIIMQNIFLLAALQQLQPLLICVFLFANGLPALRELI